MMFSLLLLFVLIFRLCAGVSIYGCLDIPTELYYVGRFGFGPNGGQLSYELKWPTKITNHPKYGIALLTASQHIATRLNSLTCSQKLSKSRMIAPKNYSTDMEGDLQFSKCNGQETFKDESFIYITDCRSGSGGLHDVTYNITLRNQGKSLRREFSADEMYMLETNLAVLFVYILMFTMGTWLLVNAFRTRLKFIFRWYYLSLCSQTCAIVIATIALACFSQTGRVLIHVQRIGQTFNCLSTPILSALLIVIGKGHSVTRRSISAADNARVGAYAITSAVASLISKLSAFSSDDVYDFPDQYKVILIISGVGALWLLTSVYHTLCPRPKIVPFYVPYLIFYCFWFLAEPIFLLVAFYALPQLDTPNIKNGVYWTLSVLGHGAFFLVIRPKGLEERFPFSLPVNKVHMETQSRDDDKEKETNQEADTK